MGNKEYTPKGGWIAYNKRRAIVEKIKAGAFALVGFVLYAAVCTICETL